MHATPLLVPVCYLLANTYIIPPDYHPCVPAGTDGYLRVTLGDIDVYLTINGHSCGCIPIAPNPMNPIVIVYPLVQFVPSEPLCIAFTVRCSTYPYNCTIPVNKVKIKDVLPRLGWLSCQSLFASQGFHLLEAKLLS